MAYFQTIINGFNRHSKYRTQTFNLTVTMPTDSKEPKVSKILYNIPGVNWKIGFCTLDITTFSSTETAEIVGVKLAL